MSDDTSSQKRSAPDSDNGERKRRRKVLSCLDCRRRKLQCDRATPACGRCTKAGRASECLYIEDPQSDGTASSNILRDTIANKQYNATIVEISKDRRIRELEAALAQNGRPITMRFPPTPDAGSIADPATPNDRESMVLRGRSFKTKYFGSTNAGANIGFIPELGSITKEAFELYPALAQMRADVRALEERVGKDADSWTLAKDQDLKTLLPPRAEADELVRLYIDTFETMYHILHLPTFWKDYESLWSAPDDAAIEFVAIILLMMACVSCISTAQQRYVAQSSVARNKSLAWIRHAEEWFTKQSYKHVTAAHFQIGCLLWLAQSCNERKMKRTWSEAGSLLRRCMSAGLHRNPDLLQKETSVLDKELRRRVWATAVDFELQSSFDRGMVSAPWLLQSDCPAPSNLYDEDLTGEKLPSSRPTSDYTPASYLHLANESLMLRSTLNAVLNNIRHTLSFDEVKHYTEEIESHLSSIPDWQDLRTDLPKAMLALRLQQYLIVLHDRQLRLATTLAERNFSKTILLETAVQIVETHKGLVAKGNHTLELFCLDPIRIALSMAHLQTFIDARTDIVLSRTFDLLAPQVMEDIVGMIQDKFYRFGRDGRQLWITLSSETVMKIRKQPDQRKAYLQQAVEKIISPMYKIMACQDASPYAAAGTNINGNQVIRLHTPKDTPQPTAQAINPHLLDLDGLDDWTFQDWFNTTDFQTGYPSLQDMSFDPTPIGASDSGMGT